MTRDDIIKLANEAELCQTIWIEEDCIELESVIQFAQLVAAAEREKFINYPKGDVVGACICGSWPGGKCLRCPPTQEHCDAIRARGTA